MVDTVVTEGARPKGGQWTVASVFGITSWLIFRLLQALVAIVLLTLAFSVYSHSKLVSTVSSTFGTCVAAVIATYLGVRIAHSFAKRYYATLHTAGTYLKPFLIFAAVESFIVGGYAALMFSQSAKYPNLHYAAEAWTYLLVGMVVLVSACFSFRYQLRTPVLESSEIAQTTAAEESKRVSRLVLFLINLTSVIAVLFAQVLALGLADSYSSLHGIIETILSLYVPLGLVLPFAVLICAVVSHVRRSLRVALLGVILPLCYIAGSLLFFYLLK